MIKHHCAAVPGSGSGERLPASVVMYLENVLRVLKGATLSESEARVHETLGSALGHSPRASLANPGDVIRSRSCHLDKWVQSGRQKGEALVQTPSPSRCSPTRLKINTQSSSGIGALPPKNPGIGGLPPPTRQRRQQLREHPDRGDSKQETAKWQNPQADSEKAYKRDQQREAKWSGSRPWFLQKRMRQRAQKHAPHL